MEIFVLVTKNIENAENWQQLREFVFFIIIFRAFAKSVAKI